MATNSSQESFESKHSAIFDKEDFEMSQIKSPKIRPSSCRFIVENSDTESDTHSESASTTKFPESVKSIVSSKAQSDRFIQQPVFRIISREALYPSIKTHEGLSKSVSISSLQQQQYQQQQQSYGSQIVEKIPSNTDSFSIPSMTETNKQFNTQNTSSTTASQNKQVKLPTYQNKNDMRRGNYNYTHNYNYNNKSMYPRNIRGVNRNTNHNRSSSTNRTSNNNSDADYVLNVDLKSSDESLAFNSDDFKSEASSAYSQINKQKKNQVPSSSFLNQAGYEKYFEHSQDDFDDMPSFKQRNIKIRNSMRQSSGSKHHSKNSPTNSTEQKSQQHSKETDLESVYSHSQTSYSNKSNKKLSNRSISSSKQKQRVIVLPGINESGTDFQVLVVPETLDYNDYPSSPGSEYDLSKFQNSSKNGTSTTLNNIRNNNTTSNSPLGGSITGPLSVSTGSVIPFNSTSRSSSLRRKATVSSKQMKILEKETKKVNRRKPPVNGDEPSVQEKLNFKSTLRDPEGPSIDFRNNQKDSNSGGIFLKRSNATRRKIGWLSTLVGVLKKIEIRCKSSWRKLKNRYKKKKLFKFKDDTIVRRNSKSSSNHSPLMTAQRDTSFSYSIVEPKPLSFMKLKRGSSITSRNSNSSNASKTSKRKLFKNNNRSKESLSRLSSFSYSKSITRKSSGNKYHRKPIEFQNREMYNIDEQESSRTSESFRKKLIQNSQESVPFKLQKLDNYLDGENQKLVERVNERKGGENEIDILKRRGFVGIINDDSSDLESQLSKQVVKLINLDQNSGDKEVGLNQLWNHYLKKVVANRIEIQLKIQKRLSGDYDKIKSKTSPNNDNDNNNNSSESSRREKLDEAIDSIASFQRKDSVLISGSSKISKESKTSTDSFLDIIIAGDNTMSNSTGVYDSDSLSNSSSGASSITCSTVSSPSGSSGSEDGGNEEYENDSDFFGNSVVSSSVNSEGQYSSSSLLASSNDYSSVILPRVALSSNRFTIPEPQLSSGISSSRSSQIDSVRYYSFDEAGAVRRRSTGGRRTGYGVNISNSGGEYLASPDSVSFYGPKSSAIRNSIFSADTVTQTYFPIIIKGGQDNLTDKKYESDGVRSGDESEAREQGNNNEEDDEDSDSDFNDIIKFHSNNGSSTLEDTNINDSEVEQEVEEENRENSEKAEPESVITNANKDNKSNPGRASRSTSSFARGFNRVGKMKTRNYLTRKQDLS